MSETQTLKEMLDCLEARCSENPNYLKNVLKRLSKEDELELLRVTREAVMNEQSKSTLQVFDEMLERKGVREESRTTDLLIQSDVQHEADAAMIQGLKGQSMCTTQMFDVMSVTTDEEADVGMVTQPPSILLFEEKLHQKIQAVSARTKISEIVEIGVVRGQETHVLRLCSNMLQNKENMTDEMLAEFKGALSTDMDLVHLLGISTSAYSIRLGNRLDTFLKVFNGVWVNEYNFRGMLIQSFDPGGNDTVVGFNHDILNAFVSESEFDKRFFVFGGCVKLFDDDSFTNLSKPIPFRAENDFKQLVILEMRQNHCFQHWADLGFDDKQKKAFCTHVAKLNSSYYWGLTSYTKIEKELLARLKIGKKSYVDFTISIPGVKVLFYDYDKFIEYEKFSVKEAEKAVFVLDASGLDEQLSYNRTKTIFPTDTTTCFLQLWVEVILTLERSNSRLTQDELAYECITASTVRIRDFGILCTYQRLYSFWPGMKSRIKNIMLNDEVCQKTHMSNLLREELQRTQHIMQLLDHPFLPSQEIMEEELVSLIHEHKLDMRENVHQWAVAINTSHVGKKSNEKCLVESSKDSINNCSWFCLG